MTHALRDLHTGILVGIGTILSDNPKLTVRRTTTNADLSRSSSSSHPTPILLDSSLRIPLHSHILTKRDDRDAPIIFMSADHNNFATQEKKKALTALGCQVIVCPTTNDGSSSTLYLGFVLETVLGLKIDSVMIEGGASVLTSCLLRPHVIDQVIVTISPCYVSNKETIFSYLN